MAAAVAGTVGGLYIVMTQDTGAGHHDDHHGEAHETHEDKDGEDDESGEDDSKDDDSKKEESKNVYEGMKQGGPKDGTKTVNNNQPQAEGGQQSEDGSKAATGRPDKKKAADSRQDAPKAGESGEADPAKSDKVGGNPATCDVLRANLYRPILAASPRAPTKPLASKKVSPTATPTTAHKSQRTPPRARRARVSLRPPRSRAPSPPTAPERRTRRSEERPSKITTRRAKMPALPLHHSVFNSPFAATVHLAASCIVCDLKISICQPSVLPQSSTHLTSRAIH
jgi:hypothetical protein